MASVIVWFLFVFSVAVRGVCLRGECCIFKFIFSLSLLVAVRGVCSRGERYSHFCFFVFPNASARVTNFREPAGLAVILKGLSPLV